MGLCLITSLSRSAGPPPTLPSALAVVPVVIGSVSGQSGNGFMAFSPDGRRFVANHGAGVEPDTGNTLLLWETASLRLRRRELLPPEYRDRWSRFVFTPEGRRLVADCGARPLL